jgi:hypothetical protein
MNMALVQFHRPSSTAVIFPDFQSPRGRPGDSEWQPFNAEFDPEEETEEGWRADVRA